MYTSRLIFLLSALLAPVSVWAADKEDRFSIRGAGVMDCKTLAEEAEKKETGYYLIAGWLDGYLTAYNQFREGTYDITSFESTELLTAIIANYCQANPEHRLYAVVNSIVQELQDDRIQEQSLATLVEVGDFRTRLYEETVRRIQRRLSELGHYSGQPDGKFGDGTAEALRKFQDKAGIEATGFPDQPTLWRLLRQSAG